MFIAPHLTGQAQMTIAFVRPVLAGGVVAFVGALAGCSSSPSAPTGVNPADVALSIVSGNAQSGPVNVQLATPIRVLAHNSAGAPVPNYVVNFVVTSGGGSVFAPAVTTDASGFAEELWTLGPRLGPQTVEARNVNQSTGATMTYGAFTATGKPPNILVVGSNATGVFIMNANGSAFKQLTTGGKDNVPNLSPDGKKIVFFSTRHADSTAVFLMNVNGTNIHQISTTITTFFDAGSNSGNPQWAPDDSLVLFLGQPTSTCAGEPPDDCETLAQPYIIDTVGAVVGGMSVGGGNEAGVPAWLYQGQGVGPAPGAGQFGFVFWCDYGCFGYNGIVSSLIFPATRQGFVGALTNPFVNWGISAIAASPDMTHIAFVGETNGTGPTYLYTMNVDGTNVTQLTKALGVGSVLSYSPDGNLIAVDHGFINADGTDYQVVAGCPCSFPMVQTTANVGLSSARSRPQAVTTQLGNQ